MADEAVAKLMVACAGLPVAESCALSTQRSSKTADKIVGRNMC